MLRVTTLLLGCLTLSTLASARQEESKTFAGDARQTIQPGARITFHLGRKALRTDGQPSRVYDLQPDFTGRLQVWAQGKGSDPRLRIKRIPAGHGRPTEVDDDSSLAQGAACTGVLVAPGDQVEITVILAREGSVELAVVAAPETETTRAAAKAARKHLAQAQSSATSGNLEQARSSLSAALGELTALDEPTHSVSLASVARSIGYTATQLGALDEARYAWTLAMAHDVYLLPPDHPLAVNNRESAAGSLLKLEAYGEAREMLEGVLEIRSRRLPRDDGRVLRAHEALGLACLGEGDGNAAKKHLARALQLLERQLPANHTRIVALREQLARAVEAQAAPPENPR